MTIDEFIRLRGITTSAFAARIRCTTEAVRLWRIGDCVPQRRFWTRISQATNGAVTPGDLVSSPSRKRKARGS